MYIEIYFHLAPQGCSGSNMEFHFQAGTMSAIYQSKSYDYSSLTYTFPKNVNAETAYPSNPTFSVGCTTGAKNGE